MGSSLPTHCSLPYVLTRKSTRGLPITPIHSKVGQTHFRFPNPVYKGHPGSRVWLFGGLGEEVMTLPWPSLLLPLQWVPCSNSLHRATVTAEAGYPCVASPPAGPMSPATGHPPTVTSTFIRVGGIKGVSTSASASSCHEWLSQQAVWAFPS